MFEAALRKKGYLIKTDPNRKYPVICSIYGGRYTRLFKLGEDYEPQRIVSRVYENDSRVWQSFHGFMHDTGVIFYPAAHSRIKTHRPKQKITGLYALYLHYLYLLGYRPKRERYQPLTPEMKAALRKCDEYSKHARLLAREHLSTESDVQELIERTDERMTSLCEKRQKINNKLRRAKDPEEIMQLRQERSDLTDEIKELRQDRKTAVQILERAVQIREDTAREYAARKQQRDKFRSRKEVRDR